MNIQITRLSNTLGAEITGVDLNADDDAAFAEINAAYLEHQVLCIRDQNLDPESLVTFSERFGVVEPHDNLKFTLAQQPKILVLSNDVDEDGNQIGVIDAGDAWHTDHSFKTHPANCTILYSLKNPSQGGVTDFTNMYAAYDALSDDMKARIANLRGRHSISKLKNKRVQISGAREDAVEFYKRQEKAIPDVDHPLVRIHPVTGRKSLYCSPRFTVGIVDLDEDEGDALLDELIAHSIEPEFRYSHQWRDSDVVMWDNRCVNHRATGGYEYPDIRHLYRTTVEGGPTE
jgi:taurine dioxygenase